MIKLDKVSNLGLAPFFAFGTPYMSGILRIAIQSQLQDHHLIPFPHFKPSKPISPRSLLLCSCWSNARTHQRAPILLLVRQPISITTPSSVVVPLHRPFPRINRTTRRLRVPLQAEKEHRSHQRANQGVKESALPISVVQNPVVLFGKGDRLSWYSLPAAVFSA